MDRDEKRPAAGNGEPREIFNWTNNNIAPEAGKVKPARHFYLLPSSPICGGVTAWLASHRQARVFWIAGTVDHVSAGLVLLASDEAIVATAVTDQLGRAAEAASAPDRTIAVIIAPVERADEWVTVARWCGLIAARFA